MEGAITIHFCFVDMLQAYRLIIIIYHRLCGICHHEHVVKFKASIHLIRMSVFKSKYEVEGESPLIKPG